MILTLSETVEKRLSNLNNNSNTNFPDCSWYSINSWCLIEGENHLSDYQTVLKQL